MSQTQNRLDDFISNKLDKIFEYHHTDHSSNVHGDQACDVYLSETERYAVFRMHKPDEEGVNFYISDAKRGCLAANEAAPSHRNIVFQGRIINPAQIDVALKMINYKGPLAHSVRASDS